MPLPLSSHVASQLPGSSTHPVTSSQEVDSDSEKHNNVRSSRRLLIFRKWLPTRTKKSINEPAARKPEPHNSTGSCSIPAEKVDAANRGYSTMAMGQRQARTVAKPVKLKKVEFVELQAVCEGRPRRGCSCSCRTRPSGSKGIVWYWSSRRRRASGE